MVKPRPTEKTVKFIDEYCEWYGDLFLEVRSFELKILNGEEIIVIVDETGDRKKGKTTDYVKRQ
jgi:SRSO17 transposase